MVANNQAKHSERGTRMNSVELNAYRLIFRNGTVMQVREAIQDIVEVESVVPDELMADIIGMLRHRGLDAVEQLAWPIHNMLGKTQSMALYEVADELGYLEISRFQIMVYTNGKVQLFVKKQFYHPDIEPLVIDELHLWLNYFEQTLQQHYAEEGSMAALDGPQFDSRLKRTQFFGASLYVIDPILSALENMASAKGRELLQSLEYMYLPRAKEYLLIEQKRVEDGDAKAVNKAQHCIEQSDGEFVTAVKQVLLSPSVYHFRDIMGRISEMARANPLDEAPGT